MTLQHTNSSIVQAPGTRRVRKNLVDAPPPHRLKMNVNGEGDGMLP